MVLRLMARYALSIGRLGRVVVWDSADGFPFKIDRIDAGTNDFASKSLIADALGRFSATSSSGGGDMNGPASSTDNAIPRFDGTGGKTIQGSGVKIDDSNNLLLAASVYSAPLVTLVPNGSNQITPSAAQGNVFQVEITANSTLMNPSNAPASGTWTFSVLVTQGAGAPWALSYDTLYFAATGLPFPVLALVEGKADLIEFMYVDGVCVLIRHVGAFF